MVSCKIGTHKKDGLFALVTMENSDFGPPVAVLQPQLHGSMWNGLRLVVRRVRVSSSNVSNDYFSNLMNLALYMKVK